MELIEQSIRIVEVGGNNFTPAELVKHHGQKCWQSESTRTPEEFVKMLIKKGHESVLEHAYLSSEFITDIGIAREILRHRHGSPSQESTNYCKYDKGIRFLKPFDWDEMTPRAKDSFLTMCYTAERCYGDQLEEGRLPKFARDNLPLCMATDVGLTGNMRYWRDMFKQRIVGTVGRPHPRVRELFLTLLLELYHREDTRVFFEDILEDYIIKVEGGPSVSKNN